MALLTDQEMDIEIGRMLQFGVAVAAIVVFIGGVLYLRTAPPARPDYVHFHAIADNLRTVPGVVRGVRHPDPATLIQLGILLLIATPVVRVAYCIVGFARQRDPLYVGISTVVFLILIYGLAQSGR